MGFSRRERITLLIILVSTFLFLTIRALSPNRWSWWDFGDGQTMMAATVFKDEGFLKTYFLWVPQPASPIAKHLDDEPVRHHAHGSMGDANTSGLGPKRLYTHWPSWYSIPYGILAKLGILNKSVFQIWASLISVLGLLFFYLFMRSLLPPAGATLALFIYIFSPGFLGFADSIATMPYDDFFRFAFLWKWSTRREDRPAWREALVPAALFFGSMMTSLDSFAFIPIVALVSDVVAGRKFRPESFVLVGMGGALALGVQFLQNAAYLGIDGAWRDWKGYFIAHGSTSGKEPVNHLYEMIEFFPRAINLPTIGTLLFTLVILFFGAISSKKTMAWLSALLVGGMAFVIILPGKSTMAYEPRQIYPFIVFGLAVTLTRIDAWLRAKMAKRRIESVNAVSFALYFVTFIAVAGNFYKFTQEGFDFTLDIPSGSHVDPAKAALFNLIDGDVPRPKVFIQIGWVVASKPYAKAGYGQAHPLDEWYSHGIILTVPDVAAMGKDLEYFWSKVPGEFEPIVLMKSVRSNIPLIDEEQLRALNLPWKLKGGWKGDGIVAYRLERTERR